MTNNTLTSSTPESQFVTSFGDLGRILLYRFENNVQKAQSAIVHDYLGTYSSKAAFARHFLKKSRDENDKLPEHLEHYKNNMLAFSEDIFTDQFFTVQRGMNVRVFAKN